MEYNKKVETKQDLEDYKLWLCQNVKRSIYPEYPKGGQSCGMPRGSKIKCGITGFEIGIETSRSMLANFDLCMTLYKLYLDETIKL